MQQVEVDDDTSGSKLFGAFPPLKIIYDAFARAMVGVEDVEPTKGKHILHGDPSW